MQFPLIIRLFNSWWWLLNYRQIIPPPLSLPFTKWWVFSHLKISIVTKLESILKCSPRDRDFSCCCIRENWIKLVSLFYNNFPLFNEDLYGWKIDNRASIISPIIIFKSLLSIYFNRMRHATNYWMLILSQFKISFSLSHSLLHRKHFVATTCVIIIIILQY